MTELERVRDSLMIAAWECVFGTGPNDALLDNIEDLGARYRVLLAQSADMLAQSSDMVMT